MGVIQWFTVELPDSVVYDGDDRKLTLSREDAESLCADLTEALHPEGVASPEAATQDLLATFLQSMQSLEGRLDPDSYTAGAANEATGRMMSPDEALARVQAMEAAVPAPAAARNPGTGIGNG